MVSCELGISHYTHFPVCNGGVLLSRSTVLRSAVVLILLMLFDIVKLSLLAVSLSAVVLLKYLMCICFVSAYRIMKESSIIVIVITCHFEGETM